jgi:hypothetical protein
LATPYTRRFGKTLIGLDKLASRKQRSIFKWQTQDKQAGVTQFVPGGYFDIPMDKLCIFTNQKEGDNFEGISMLRQAYKNWMIADKLTLVDAIRHERQGLGIIEVIPPLGANETDVDAAITAARQARSNEEAVIKHNKDWIVQFMDLKAGSASNTDVLGSITHHNREALKAFLAQFLDLGQGKSGGSRSLSEDHSALFIASLEAIIKNVISTIQKQVIKPLVDYNFSKVTAYPTLEHSKIGDSDITVLAGAISSLVTAGALTPDAGMEQAIRTLVHLPDLPEEYEADYNNRPTAQPTVAPAPSSAPQDESKNDKVDAGDALEKARQARMNLIHAADKLYAEHTN